MSTTNNCSTKTNTTVEMLSNFYFKSSQPHLHGIVGLRSRFCSINPSCDPRAETLGGARSFIIPDGGKEKDKTENSIQGVKGPIRRPIGTVLVEFGRCEFIIKFSLSQSNLDNIG